ncbi:hypothetical protein ES708_07628 [subsurface metagenome]
MSGIRFFIPLLHFLHFQVTLSIQGRCKSSGHSPAISFSSFTEPITVMSPQSSLSHIQTFNGTPQKRCLEIHQSFKEVNQLLNHLLPAQSGIQYISLFLSNKSEDKLSVLKNHWFVARYTSFESHLQQ